MTLTPDVPQDAVEAVARALSKSARGKDRYWKSFVTDARAAITAAAPFLRAAVVEECAKVADEQVQAIDVCHRYARNEKARTSLFAQKAAVTTVAVSIRSLSPTGGAR